MLDMLKSVRDRFSEKTKLIIYISATAVIFVICALTPLAFRGEIITDGIFDTGQRAALFAKYIHSDKTIKTKVDNKPDKTEIKYCKSVFENVYDSCVIDEVAGKTVTEGYDFLTISDGENDLRVCRMWVQDQGDWTNWLDVYMDVDTGFIYYLYISSTCLYNANKYYDSAPTDLSTKSVAELIASGTGFGLKLLNWSGNPEATGTAYTTLDGDVIIWDINCLYYPSSMLDIKICVA